MQIVDRIESEDRTLRAQIVLRKDGLFQVRMIRWTEEKIDGLGLVARFWTSVPISASITDRLEHAQAMAAELIAEAGSNEAWPC